MVRLERKPLTKEQLLARKKCCKLNCINCPYGFKDGTMIGEEASKSHYRRTESGFYDKYMSGIGLDIGYSGYTNSRPILDSAVGVDLKYPGYDGIHLPFDDESQNYVFSSHTLEHIKDYKSAIKEWYRVLKVGGYIVTIVPHQFLYEKKNNLPSKWNGDHKRFYTPAKLLSEFEESLEPNSYRVRHLLDNDEGHDYTKGPEHHGSWCYEIECVIEKLEKPTWTL